MSRMIPDPKDYFSTFVPLRDELLESLEQEATREGIPIVGPVVGELLYILAKAVRAQSILELGTATGYSAIYLARGLAAGGRVLTLENDPEMAARARENMRRAGLEDKVEVLVGDALDLMAGMEDSFDLVFLDIDKELYLPALAHVERLLKKGGLMVADNVAFAAARDYNRELFERRGFRTVHLLCHLPLHSPEEDGLAISVRTETA